MDSFSGGGGLGNIDLARLSDRDKQELQQFVMNEGQKARIQSCMQCPSPFLHHTLPTNPSILEPSYKQTATTTCACVLGNFWLIYDLQRYIP